MGDNIYNQDPISVKRRGPNQGEIQIANNGGDDLDSHPNVYVTSDGGLNATYFTGDGGNLSNITAVIGPGTSNNLAYFNSENTITSADFLTITTSPNTLTVNGDLTTVGNLYAIDHITTDDTIILLANNNTSSTLASGIMLNRPGANVFYGVVNNTNSFAIGLTNDPEKSLSITMLDSEEFQADVYGSVAIKGDNQLLFTDNVLINTETSTFGRIAIGYLSGNQGQDNNSVAIGVYSGYQNQGGSAIAIGNAAGNLNQNNNSIAIGTSAGSSGQFESTIAIGTNSGANQREYSIAIGSSAGNDTQSERTVAIGENAGRVTQGVKAIAIGSNAGQYDQDDQGVAIGTGAGEYYQEPHSIAIGQNAGSNVQGINSISIGQNAGREQQDFKSIAIGLRASEYNQGSESVSIGADSNASATNTISIGNNSTAHGQYATTVGSGAAASGNYSMAMGPNAKANAQNAIAIGSQSNANTSDTIVLNASGTNLTSSNSSSFYVNPIRHVEVNSNVLSYDRTSKEIVDTGLISISGSNVVISNLETDLNLQQVTDNGRITTNTVEFQNSQTALIVTETNSNIYFESNIRIASNDHRISIGKEASTSGGERSIYIGQRAGQNSSGNDTIGIGYYAGRTLQGINSIAIGPQAGTDNQQQYAIAIGNSAGQANQGVNAIAIGNLAGAASQDDNTIVLNATGSALDTTVADSFYVKPIRGVSTAVSNVLSYRQDGEVLDTKVISINGTDATITNNIYAQSGIFNGAGTSIETDLSSNVLIKLDQLSNVVINNPLEKQVLQYVDGNWINDWSDLVSVIVRADVNLPKGAAVYVSGSTGDIPNANLAISSDSTKMPAIGLVLDEGGIAQGNQGHVVTFGEFPAGSFNFQEGEILYISNTSPGGLMNTKPTNVVGPDLIQNIGIFIQDTGGNGDKILVTGVGRANDIPNASILPDDSTVDYVYVNTSGNDLKKIDPSKLTTNVHTLEQVTSVGNTTSHTVYFQNDTLSFKADSDIEVGTANLFVDTTTGNVGINTSVPSTKLEVRETATTDAVRIYGGAVGRDMLKLTRNTTAGDPSTSVLAQIGFNGKNSDPQIYFYEGSSNFALGLKDSDGTFRIASSDTIGTNDRLTIKQTGNVGIGTTNPDAQLEIQNDTAGRNNLLVLRNDNPAASFNYLNFKGLDSATNDTTYGRIACDYLNTTNGSEDSNLVFSTIDVNLIERARITKDTVTLSRDVTMGTIIRRRIRISGTPTNVIDFNSPPVAQGLFMVSVTASSPWVNGALSYNWVGVVGVHATGGVGILSTITSLNLNPTITGFIIQFATSPAANIEVDANAMPLILGR